MPDFASPPVGDPFASSEDVYSIVVAGNMNPAIHHPAWYKIIKALSDEDYEAGIAQPSTNQLDMALPGSFSIHQLMSPPFLCTSALAQFTAGPIRVTCLQQNWTISTFDKGSYTRVRQIAALVFETLRHTPVSAFGFNFQFHRKTKTPQVGARLAVLLGKAEIGISKLPTGLRSAKIGYTVNEEGRVVNISVEPSVRGADMVFIGINTHHPIVSSVPGFQLFDLTPLLEKAAASDLLDASEICAATLSNFDGSQ